MLKYNPKNKANARKLRSDMTDAERIIWSHVRRKQILGIQFYRQKPIGNFIVDFYAPAIKLVLEIDGAQHVEPEHLQRDKDRDAVLNGMGLLVLRLNNNMVMTRTQDVIQHIYQTVEQRCDT